MKNASPHGDSINTNTFRVARSLAQRALQNDKAAINAMFRQFIPQDEEIVCSEYLGRNNIFWLGQNSFGCLTTRRVATIRIRLFGEVIYQDGFLEHLHGSIVYQPSQMILFLILIILLATALISFGTSLLLTPSAGWIFYTFKKSGVVFWVRGGAAIYLFTNRRLVGKALAINREMTKLREERIRHINQT
jgi:hypothetical protein